MKTALITALAALGAMAMAAAPVYADRDDHRARHGRGDQSGWEHRGGDRGQHLGRNRQGRKQDRRGGDGRQQGWRTVASGPGRARAGRIAAGTATSTGVGTIASGIGPRATGAATIAAKTAGAARAMTARANGAMTIAAGAIGAAADAAMIGAATTIGGGIGEPTDTGGATRICIAISTTRATPTGGTCRTGAISTTATPASSAAITAGGPIPAGTGHTGPMPWAISCWPISIGIRCPTTSITGCLQPLMAAATFW